jgi:endonuclease G
LVILTNAAYLTGYCETRRNPAWVAFSVGNITIGSTSKRPSRLITDTRAKSATHAAFTGSGYDRGHMAPNFAIATRYGQEAQRETFLMSNICPQAPDLNRIWWRRVEEKEANDFAVRLERVWVITGPIFEAAPKRLRGGVEVPAAFYRIILDEESGQPRALAFIAPQTATGRESLEAFLVSVRDVEAQTGLDFHPALSKEAQDRLEAPRAASLW